MAVPSIKSGERESICQRRKQKENFIGLRNHKTEKEVCWNVIYLTCFLLSWQQTKYDQMNQIQRHEFSKHEPASSSRFPVTANQMQGFFIDIKASIGGRVHAEFRRSDILITASGLINEPTTWLAWESPLTWGYGLKPNVRGDEIDLLFIAINESSVAKLAIKSSPSSNRLSSVPWPRLATFSTCPTPPPVDRTGNSAKPPGKTTQTCFSFIDWKRPV